MYTMGLDIGSTATKGIILKSGKEIVASSMFPLGTGTSGPNKVKKELLEKAKLERSRISKIVVTGYGRMTYEDADMQISELSCHARGITFAEPDIRTIIDIGGQDAKALQLDKNGKLQNFVMNDKCAAGTGRFLDVMAKILETDVDNLGKLSKESKNEVSISSTCTVFAESEVISHLSSDANIEDIVAGIHTSIAKRVASLVIRLGVTEKIAMVGGVAKNEGVVRAMEKILKKDIVVPNEAQLNGALGASLYAYDEAVKSKENVNE